MNIYLRDNPYRFDTEQTAIILFPERRPRVTDEVYPAARPLEDHAVVSLQVTEKSATAVCVLQMDGRIREETARFVFPPDMEEEARRTQTRHAVRRSVYKAFTVLTGERPPWGALAGVRPGKLARLLTEETGSADAARKVLVSQYAVREDKAALALRAAAAASALKSRLSGREAAVYLSVPYCPTRCAYCSFISTAAPKANSGEMDAYVDLLCREAAEAGRQLARSGVRVRALYIGGGTPTTLSEHALARLLDAAQAAFPLTGEKEFTLEAGRPDTITEGKLEAAVRYGVNRISINPQTYTDRILRQIGRPHTAADIEAAYEMTRRYPALRINMDLIAGLPGDSLAGFANSVTRTCVLYPEEITVHTLAAKRGADMSGPDLAAALSGRLRTGEMLDCGAEIIDKNGYAPYYLYRQKYSGGLENVGYARDGFVCAYNLYMMDELLPVVACGAGSVTKLGLDETGRMVRTVNPKYPGDYLAHSERVLESKEKIGLFFKQEQTRQTDGNIGNADFETQ